MNAYVARVIDYVKTKHANEPEFCQTVEEVFHSISPVIDAHPEYEKADLLTRMVEPERMFTFRVVWTDDNGQAHTNIGYRCQFNGAIGPYKGGLRFQKNVTPSVIKFLGFEQTFKNSLTGLPIGGGKGGADFDPRGKSNGEIMRFCQAFMTELWRHIGPETDVPAGDIGVGAREIGYLFGQYKRLRDEFTGVLTGKGQTFGGSPMRPEATGFGACYFGAAMLATRGESYEGKTVAISDCEPDVSALEELLVDKARKVVVKLSPMLDLSLALKDLKHVCEVHIVSTDNECKELLLILQKETASTEVSIHCINSLGALNGYRIYQEYAFTQEQERTSDCPLTHEVEAYLYEPNASIMKAGAYRSLTQAYPVKKLHPSSHLYVSPHFIEDFPGRKFQVEAVRGFGKKELKTFDKFAGKASEIRFIPDGSE